MQPPHYRASPRLQQDPARYITTTTHRGGGEWKTETKRSGLREGRYGDGNRSRIKSINQSINPKMGVAAWPFTTNPNYPN